MNSEIERLTTSAFVNGKIEHLSWMKNPTRCFMTNPNLSASDSCALLRLCLAVFISHLIARETINIPEIILSIHGFPGLTVTLPQTYLDEYYTKLWIYQLS